MQGQSWPIVIHLSGELSENAQGSFRMPEAATLVELSVGASNEPNATFQVGTAPVAQGLYTAQPIGALAAPAILTADGPLIEPGSHPFLARGTVITWLLDFDGDAGTPARDVTILFAFAP